MRKQMNAHGAYTKLMTAIRHVRGYAHDSSLNVKALFSAGPLDEDRVLIERMNDLAERFKSLEASLHKMKAESYDIARKYLGERHGRVTRDHFISGGSPTMRVRTVKTDWPAACRPQHSARRAARV
jgi:hypothetical protein